MTRNTSTDRRPADLMQGFMTVFDLPGGARRAEAPLFGGLSADRPVDQAIIFTDIPDTVSEAEFNDLFANPGKPGFNAHEEFDPHAYAPFFGSAAA